MQSNHLGQPSQQYLLCRHGLRRAARAEPGFVGHATDSGCETGRCLSILHQSYHSVSHSQASGKGFSMMPTLSFPEPVMWSACACVLAASTSLTPRSSAISRSRSTWQQVTHEQVTRAEVMVAHEGVPGSAMLQAAASTGSEWKRHAWEVLIRWLKDGERCNVRACSQPDMCRGPAMLVRVSCHQAWPQIAAADLQLQKAQVQCTLHVYAHMNVQPCPIRPHMSRAALTYPQPYLLIHSVDEDCLVRVGAGQQECVCAAVGIEQLPEDDAVEDCKRHSMGTALVITWLVRPLWLGLLFTPACVRSCALPAASSVCLNHICRGKLGLESFLSSQQGLLRAGFALVCCATCGAITAALTGTTASLWRMGA